jgi:phospholipase C
VLGTCTAPGTARLRRGHRQYTVVTDMDSPNPDSGEDYFHTNTQLFNILDDHNRFKIGEGAAAPWNAPPPGAVPTMDGFVTDYISTFTGETGRQPHL